MIFEILAAILIGCIAGTITGLIPGIHINLVSLLLVSISGYFLGFTSPLVLVVFIIAMAVTHTFVDVIPSVFLGAPDADQALSALPGHRLLLKGRGFEAVRLATMGSLLCLITTILIIPLLAPFIPFIFSFLQPFIGWILLFVVALMIWREKGIKKLWGLFVFLISGILGLIVLNGNLYIEQPLLPLLSGLFGVSMLIIALTRTSWIPVQEISETIHLSKKELVKVIGAGTFAGSLTGLFPGLGAAQAAIIGNEVIGKIRDYAFIVLVGGVNTVNFVFSLLTLFAIEKARNGAVVAAQEIISSINVYSLVVFLCAALIAGGIAVFLTMYFARVFARIITKIDYSYLCTSVIAFVSLLVLYFSSWAGLLVLIVASFTGMIPTLVKVKKSHAMGVLLLPVILYFIL